MPTIDEAKAWGREHAEECLKTYSDCDEILDEMRTPLLETVWVSGCWMNHMLTGAGATIDQKHNIGLCHGQRCTYCDPWQVAVDYVNEFQKTNTVADQPGWDLAERLFKEHENLEDSSDSSEN